jgi:hypothetical protein
MVRLHHLTTRTFGSLPGWGRHWGQAGQEVLGCPRGSGTMARVELIAVRLEELGATAPTPGAEVVLGGVCYPLLSVTSPKGRPRDEARAGRWKLLPRLPETSTANNESWGGE